MSVVEAEPVAVGESVSGARPQRTGIAVSRIRMAVGVVVTVGLVAAVVGGIWRRTDAPGSPLAIEELQSERSVSVIVEVARQADFERALNVQGNVEAKRFAMVSPRVAGVLDAVFADEGDRVEADETRLFQTDSVKLTKTVEVRRREVDVAENTLREKQASREKNEADYEKADYDWNRTRDLYEKGIASNDELKEAEAEHKRCAAMLKHADALVNLADAQLAQARSALAIAAKDLEDSLVRAPINGRVTQRFREPGEMGVPGDPVVRLEDASLVEVSVFLPAQAYGEVVVGKTEMCVLVNGLNLGERVVSYKSPTIDARLRTFEARCLLTDPPAAVAPGAMAQVRVVLERREGLGVPRGAIQQRAGGAVVFVVDGGRARMIPVIVGLEADGLIEVMSAELQEGADVVAVGGYFLDPDAPIKVQQEGR